MMRLRSGRKFGRRRYTLRASLETLEPRIALDATPSGGANPYEDFLQLTEFMYNPADPTPAEIAAGFTDNDDFEFMEFYNSSAAITLNLTGVRITQGPSVPFDFAGSSVTSLGPGQYVLVVRNEAAFKLRYGAALDSIIAGQYSGSLNNAGEAIIVVDPASVELHNIDYKDTHPWPLPADGFGFSLNLINPSGDPDSSDPANWTTNGPSGGSPGAANVASQPGIVINEILAHTDPPDVDQIELLNPTASPVNVGGWFLTDDPTLPQKYTIPAGQTISAGGYLVLLEDNDGNPNTNPGPNFFGSAFALSAVGEPLYLLAGNGSNLLGYSESFEFGASLNNESLGRFPNGTGELYPMQIKSFGGPNSDPRFGPVIISEIMYNPPTPGGGGDPDLLEFIEIRNTSPISEELTNWQINGVGYTFPAGKTLAPGGVLVIVRFDPVADAVAIANFNAAYGVNIGANQQQYVGPYPGSLDNGGERLTLYSTDEPPASMPDVIPLIFEDQADYDDRSPWPTSADGTGDSLHRTATDLFGNFATSWNGADPSPGSVSFLVPGDMDFDGIVDFDDIDDFVLGINDPIAYEAMYGVSPAVHGDTDGDGDLDFDDIDDFVSILQGSPLAASAAQQTSASAYPLKRHTMRPFLPDALSSRLDKFAWRNSKATTAHQHVSRAVDAVWRLRIDWLSGDIGRVKK